MTDADVIARLPALLAAQRAAFDAEPRRALERRREDLKAIEDLAVSTADALAEAVSADFGGRSKNETRLVDVAPVAQAARHARRHLAAWARPTRVATPATLAPGRSLIRHEPKGVVGVVSPWNYPVQLALSPIVSALAAGNRVMLKPSELTPNTNAVLRRALAARFPEERVAVVEGGPDVGKAFCDLPFDHLFYTGSTRVGRAVAQAAAANLTPVTLELGGKSPAIVLPGADVQDAAHPIAWGRFLNAGQTCVAPDYVLAPAASARAVAEAVIARAGAFYPEAAGDPDYTAIVSDRHYARLDAMIEEARAGGATVLQPPHDAEAARRARKIPPTVLLNPPAGCLAMQEEIFGPILPVVGYDALDDAIGRVAAGERPLALYVFGRDRAAIERVLDRTWSGGVSLNATMLHLGNEDLPFGGSGASGYGAYHGRRGFEEFSHARAVFDAPPRHTSRLVAPPYGWLFRAISSFAMKR